MYLFDVIVHSMNLFRSLTPKESHQFRQWARENYTPFSPISGLWHPVIQEECSKINKGTRLPGSLEEWINDPAAAKEIK